MKWKIFLTVCISTFLISFPYNIIGCGPAFTDPYDYFSSFFNPDIAEKNSYSPFYYTAYADMYNAQETVDVIDVISNEWATYCGSNVTKEDAKTFVMDLNIQDISNLFDNIKQHQDKKIPDSILANTMSKYFKDKEDTGALEYILFAKKVEKTIPTNGENWEANKNDSIGAVKLMSIGKQYYNDNKNDFIKLKYAFQLVKLAFYTNNYDDAVKYYDNYIDNVETKSVLKPMALSYKAGATFRKRKNTEAVYLFSKAFSMTDAKKVSNYLSFRFSLDQKTDVSEYLFFCKNNKEKADLLALIALRISDNSSDYIKKVFEYNPDNTALTTLVSREINMFEDKYFTPKLGKLKGGTLFTNNWFEQIDDSSIALQKIKLNAFIKLLENFIAAKNKDQSFYLISAAHCSLLLNNYENANAYLLVAKKQKLNSKLNDQWQLTNLLTCINESKNITPAIEEKLLPSLKWLQKKAEEKSNAKNEYGDFYQWKVFYRNIMATALAKKYHQQGDIYKEAMCVGAADKVYAYSNYVAVNFLHENTNSTDVERIYALINSNSNTKFDDYLVNNNSLNSAIVADYAGTAYLRNFDYTKAILWLNKQGATKKDTIYKSAFIELLQDIEERLPSEKKTTSKLQFAQEMLEAQKNVETDKAHASKYYYKIATGMYNITYYGHAWELVQYYRSGSDGYEIPKNATEFQRQYYGCFAAHDMYKKALDASTDKNFKAKCLFMMAKCSQKTAGKKYGYNEANYTYEKAASAEKLFFKNFKNNKYFPQFIKEYKGTAFYKEAFSSCSYLRDFEKKKR